jgi:tRNA-dihydrouridine synthase 3
MEKKPADIGPECHNFLTFGKCHYGLACRFGKIHISDESRNIINTELFEKVCKDKITLNVLEKELQVKLWKKKYDFSKANDNVCQIKKWCQEKTQERVASQSTNLVVCDTGEGPIMLRNQEKKIVRSCVLHDISNIF